MTGVYDGRWYYQVSVQPPSDLTTSSLAAISTTFEIRTTDQYGGRSRGGAGTIVQSCP